MMYDVHTWGFIGGLLVGVTIGLLIALSLTMLIREREKND